jgi:serine/threonine protein kinase
VSSHSEKSSRRHRSVVPLEDAPTQIILADDPALLADSRASTVELSLGGARASGVVVTTEDRTVISKRAPSDDQPPPIHIGPLESRRALEGESLDHFKLERYVGGGGMGAVYRAFDSTLNRHVAVKILSRDQSDQETVRRFRNEAQSAARLDDPHIARVYYVGEDKGWNFIVFEFIEGTNLRELVERSGPLSLEDALDYTMQVAEALTHAAKRDVVHRDIKPSNVLVTADGMVKLVDMGLARLHQVESGSDDLTQSGVTLGTFDYISPEQARDPRLADVRSDIYSLGCTLYFMLAGRAPFPDGTALQKLIRHNSDDPPDVRLFRPDVPDEVVAILSRMLAKKPEQRFQSPLELILAIERVSQRLDLNLAASSSRLAVKWPVIPAEPTPWWQRVLPVAIASGTLLVMAVLPELLHRGSSEPPPVARRAAPLEPREFTATKAEKSRPASSATASQESKVDSATSAVGLPTEDLRPGRNDVAVTDSDSSATDDPAPGEAATPTVDVPPPEKTTPVAVVTRKRLIVGMAPSSDDAIQAANIVEACRYATSHPEVTEIELAFTGKRTVTGNLELGSKELVIRAAVGHTPEIVFQPSPDAASDERRLIRLLLPGSHLSLQGVKLRLDVPSSRSDWTLLQYPPEANISLDRCVVTVNNGDSPDARNAFQVSVLEPGLRLTTTLPSVPSPGAANLTIQQSIVRGEATLLRDIDDSPVRLAVSDSFVASSDRLLETWGGHQRPEFGSRVSMVLERSTIAATSGLVLVGARSDRPYHSPVAVEQQSSIVVTSSNAPLVEFRETETSEQPPITFTGTNNFYPRTTVFFRHQFRHDGIDEQKDSGFGSLPSWATDLVPFTGTLTAAPPETPAHDHLPVDYLLKSPANTNAGCSNTALPMLEPTTKRSATGMSTMGTMKSDMLMPTTDDKPTMRP